MYNKIRRDNLRHDESLQSRCPHKSNSKLFPKKIVATKLMAD